jgi:hypothetical protein
MYECAVQHSHPKSRPFQTKRPGFRGGRSLIPWKSGNEMKSCGSLPIREYP